MSYTTSVSAFSWQAQYAQGRNYSKSPDLYITTTNLNGPLILEYDLQSRKFFVEWNYYCPKSNWKQTKRMISLPDLANAYLYYSMLNIPPEIFAGVQPANGEITFDLTTIKIKDFSKVIMPPPPPTDFTTVISKEKRLHLLESQTLNLKNYLKAATI